MGTYLTPVGGDRIISRKQPFILPSPGQLAQGPPHYPFITVGTDVRDKGDTIFCVLLVFHPHGHLSWPRLSGKAGGILTRRRQYGRGQNKEK